LALFRAAPDAFARLRVAFISVVPASAGFAFPGDAAIVARDDLESSIVDFIVTFAFEREVLAAGDFFVARAPASSAG
jgi:hypothetical protein